MEEPVNYKVLMSNLPEAMQKECMVRVMLEQARLHDVESMAFRKGGKCLVTFSSYASAYRCITHVQGRQWGSSTQPVHALYVRTVKRPEGSQAPRKLTADAATLSADAPEFSPLTAAAVALSADAPEFSPSCLVPSSKPLSADAPVFVMPPQVACDQFAEKAVTRDHFFSDASTEGGDFSEASPRCLSD